VYAHGSSYIGLPIVTKKILNILPVSVIVTEVSRLDLTVKGVTQVVWRNSQQVGCGSANCPGGGKFVVCSYNPPGNFNGQRPYLQLDNIVMPSEVEESREQS